MSLADLRLFDTDPLSGRTEWFHYDPDTDGFYLETVEDVTGLIETNKALANDAPLRWGDGALVAQIPHTVLMELAKQQIVTTSGVILDEPRFRRWLNDRDNRCFRMRPGIV